MLKTMLSGLALSVALGLVCADAGYAAPSCDPAKAAQNYPGLTGKVITIGADPQTPPYVMRDNADFSKIVGVDADLARAVFDCDGLKYKFVLGAWSGLLPAVQAGQIDVMWDDLYYNPDRGKVVDFVMYMRAGTATLVAAGNPKRIAAMDDLCGKVVSAGVGSNDIETVQKQSTKCVAEGRPAITTMPFQDLASGLRLLDAGRADAILWDLGFVDNLAAEEPTKYQKAFDVPENYQIGAAMPNGDTELRTAVYNGLQAVQQSGEEAKILEKYHLDPTLESPATEIITQ